jgi:acylphosphatase
VNEASASAVRFRIRGKVQGVFFRASTRTEAQRLGLRGHARNLADGSVEVLAVGDEGAIAALERWLQHGPPNARVDEVARSDADAAEAGAGFVTA